LSRNLFSLLNRSKLFPFFSLYQLDLIVTKLALRNSSRAIYYYMNIVDATITRTMMHTQWKILGSGPYSSLSPDHKCEILDHISERYFALSDRHPVSRYEFAAHIALKNRALYNDLVLSGLLWSRARGNESTKDDDWLSPDPPLYWTQEVPLLLHGERRGTGVDVVVSPLWFHLPYVNGKRPGNDTPWVRFLPADEEKLEEGFNACFDAFGFQDEGATPELGVFGSDGQDTRTTSTGIPVVEDDDLSDFDDALEDHSVESCHPASGGDLCPDHLPECFPPYACDSSPNEGGQYPTIANWYEPDLDTDVLVDQSRHAVSFITDCDESDSFSLSSHSAKMLPQTKMVMRPTLWRFHGSQTHEVRRAAWLLETNGRGLQPYSDDSSAILEDAYMFLRYYCCASSEPHSSGNGGNNIAGVPPLSVEVRGPDGDELQLVQFQSLTNVTAIQKTLGGAVQVFKRRVYRGGLVASPDKCIPHSGKETSIEGEGLINDACNILDNTDVGNSENYPECEANFDGERSHAVVGNASPSLSIAAPLQSRVPEEPHGGDSDDNTEHLVLVIHGIGEMMRSVDVFGMGLPALCSIVDCCGWLRRNHAAVHAAHFSDFKNVNKNSSFTQEEMASAIMGRVEYLPVEWHDAFALKTKRKTRDSTGGSESTTLKDISLKTIPALREFANDTLLDVLYFMSPPHHDVIIDIVVKELHQIVTRYQRLTGFGGKISILAHSLGSVISWDILSHQTTDLHQSLGSPPGSLSPFTCSPRTAKVEDSAPEISGLRYPQLKFRVQHFFMVGSPVAVFLMLRNEHEPLREDFSLPGCARVYNIFHPYDPAAYRIEPLISVRNASVDSKIIPHWKGGLRVKYQTKYILKKLVDETRRRQKSVADAVEAGIAGIGLLDDEFVYEENDELSSTRSDDSGIETIDCGSLNQGRRIDFMLQEKEIENANEYVFALAAHSSYWNEKDLSCFLVRQIFRSSLDEENGCTNNEHANLSA